MATCYQCHFFGEKDGYCKRRTCLVNALQSTCKYYQPAQEQERQPTKTHQDMKKETAEKYGIETAVCATCGETKPLKEFLKNRWGYTKTCKACHKAKVRKTASAEEPIVTQQLQQPAALESYSDGELVRELQRRGYQGAMQKVYILTEDK